MKLSTKNTDTKPFLSTEETPLPKYAKFHKRALAFLIDNIIIGTTLSFLVFVILPFFNITYLENVAFPGTYYTGTILSAIVLILTFLWIVTTYFILSSWLYFSLMESSSKQATIGKMIVGIKVVDYKMGRIGFGKASGRYFSKILSQLILFIGFFMAAFTRKKQGLHDLIASTLVIIKD